MKKFMCEDFLLSNDIAQVLYHDYAKPMPIFDFHNHLSPSDIASHKTFSNITDVWLRGDHYKWRAMRTVGVEEHFITGNASDKEKFFAWAETIPKCIGSPLYHWTHLELKRYFGIELLLSSDTAEAIWKETNEKLASPNFTAVALLKKMNVQFVGTTDDPLFDLKDHDSIANDNAIDFTVSPSWRPDRAINISDTNYASYIDKLAATCHTSIHTFDDLKSALFQRLQHFEQRDCRSADHGIENMFFACPVPESTLTNIMQKRRNGEEVSDEESQQYATALTTWLASEYRKRNWAMQFHIGAQRNNNSRMLRQLGRDAGYDSIGDKPFSLKLGYLLDAMESQEALPKTILYTLNPSANEMIATMVGNFQQGGVPGKIQFGSAWWFNDQKDGIERHLQQVSQLGVLSQFVGMLTDSRSFLSFTRHEYFRRILCNLVGTWVAKGEAPNDMPLLGQMIQNICFNNANLYFSK